MLPPLGMHRSNLLRSFRIQGGNRFLLITRDINKVSIFNLSSRFETNPSNGFGCMRHSLEGGETTLSCICNDAIASLKGRERQGRRWYVKCHFVWSLNSNDNDNDSGTTAWQGGRAVELGCGVGGDVRWWEAATPWRLCQTWQKDAISPARLAVNWSCFCCYRCRDNGSSETDSGRE